GGGALAALAVHPGVARPGRTRGPGGRRVGVVGRGRRPRGDARAVGRAGRVARRPGGGPRPLRRAADPGRGRRPLVPPAARPRVGPAPPPVARAVPPAGPAPGRPARRGRVLVRQRTGPERPPGRGPPA